MAHGEVEARTDGAAPTAELGSVQQSRRQKDKLLINTAGRAFVADILPLDSEWPTRYFRTFKKTGTT